MNINTIPTIILTITLIVALAYSHFDKKRHVPHFSLDEELGNNIVKYGLLHFTTLENAKYISEEKTLKCFPDKAMYSEEEKMIWFFPCCETVNNDSINKYYIKIKPKRKNVDVCINILDIKATELDEYLYQPTDGYVVHNNDLCKPMIFYILQNGMWHKTDI